MDDNQILMITKEEVNVQQQQLLLRGKHREGSGAEDIPRAAIGSASLQNGGYETKGPKLIGKSYIC